MLNLNSPTQAEAQISSVASQTSPLPRPPPASPTRLVNTLSPFHDSLQTMHSLLLDLFILVSPTAAASSNGEFGDWNAFSVNSPTSSNAGPTQPVSDLFGSAHASTASAPTSIPPSAELFDLMGGISHQMTNQHATLSASQSLTFSMGGVTPGAPVALPTMPLSRSQQVGTVHIKDLQTCRLFCAAKMCCFGHFLPDVIFLCVWSAVV